MNIEDRTDDVGASRLDMPPESTDKARSLRQKAKAMYREAVLSAAEQVFCSQGIRNTRMQDIARRAGVSVGTVYNHFAQKEDIITELMAEHERELFGAFEAKPGDPSDFAGSIHARHDRMIRLIDKHLRFYSMAIYEGGLLVWDLARAGSELSAARDATEKRIGHVLVELLEQGMREGVVRHQDPDRLRYYYSGAVHGMLIAVLKNPSLNLIEESRFVLDLFLRSVSANTPI
jgi:AcrR family transcriptional regulator